MLEGFMELVISGYLEHSNPLSTSSGEAKAQFVGYLSLFLALIVLPCLLIWVLIQEKNTLRERAFV
jgi:hypothetical protein